MPLDRYRAHRLYRTSARRACGLCAACVQRILGRHEGVADADVNFATGPALVRLDGAATSDEALAAAVDRIGCRPEPVRADEPRTSRAEEERSAQRMWLRRILGLLSPIVAARRWRCQPVAMALAVALGVMGAVVCGHRLLRACR